jgi:hypothetical protein
MLMQKLIAVVLFLVATTSFAAPESNVVGSYRGPNEAYGLILERTAAGDLRGNYVEEGHVAVLSSIEVKGSEFKARASFDNGSTRMIKGSFETRGSAFGLHVDDVDAFFEKM